MKQNIQQEYAIEVKDVDKSFWIPDEHVGSFKGYFLQPWKLFHKKGRKFEALNDISFNVKKGEFVGIIGRNGSGKSTLLKLIAGIYEPNKGSIKIHGKLVPFLELGVGFNPDLSARENIFLNGTILGMSKKFLETKVKEILSFAGVTKFADTPIKNFSSGMTVRLAFSIAIQAKADIYLLDEVLAVGDEAFRRKSMGKIEELIRSGVTVLFVSHDLSTIEKLTNRVIWINNSRIAGEGNPKQIVEDFQINMMSDEERIRYIEAKKELSKSKSDSKVEKFENGTTSNGDGRANITDVKIVNSRGENVVKIYPEEKLKVVILVDVYDKLLNPVVYFSLRDNIDYELFAISSDGSSDCLSKPLNKGDRLLVTFEFVNILNPGEYNVWVQINDFPISQKQRAVVDIERSYKKIEVIDAKSSTKKNWNGKVRVKSNCTYKRL